MPDFIPGLDLSEAFYREAVRPIVEAHFGDVPHSAALIGNGSEVLGYDTPQSRDHGWGPRVLLFVSEQDHARHGADIASALAGELPYTFRGYSTHFAIDPESGDHVLAPRHERPIAHGVTVHTLRGFVLGVLAADPSVAFSSVDWLTFGDEALLSLTAGRVFYDGLGSLEPLRRRLAYYPDDVWRVLLAAGWRRVEQEEPFVGRAGDVGDEVGSQIVAARLARDVMRLGFMMERQYAPYPKWFGTAFARLACAADLLPALSAALSATAWREREAHLCRAYETLAAMHNTLGLTTPLDSHTSPFYNRPYTVIHAGRFAQAIAATIQDERLRRIAVSGLGGVDQWVDSTDVLSYPARRARLKAAYDQGA